MLLASMYLYYHPTGNQDISYPEPPPGSALERLAE